MKVTIDFETRSEIDLRKAGMWAYAEHPTTEPMCLAVKIDGNPPSVWIPDKFQEIIAPVVDWRNFPRLVEPSSIHRIVAQADIVEAHNAGFEISMWQKVMTARYGWPTIPIRRWRCSAAKAAALALPRALGDACKALGLPVQKSMEGRRIMLKLCKPRPRWKEDPSTPKWYEDAADLIKLYRYCARDVDSEYCLSETLPELSAVEQVVWMMDFVINSRGIPIDLKTARLAVAAIQKHEKILLARMKALTGGAVASPKQRDATLDWLRGQGVKAPDLQKATVAELLGSELPPVAREVLEIRQSLAKSSTAKYQAFITSCSADGRARDTKLYHGASTGRWAGKRIQPDNMPRGEFEDTDRCIELLHQGDLDTISLLYGGLTRALSTCVRPTIMASPGKEFLCADYSSIEGRGLAWVAGETKILRNYEQGLDAYKIAAADILKKRYEDITKAERQRPGKVAELACGYQGGAAACRRFGAEGTDKELKEQIVNPWRENRQKTVNFWRGVEDAAVNATASPTGEVFRYRAIRFGKRDGFLFCRLPSGRYLAYFKPSITWVVLIGLADKILKFPGHATQQEAEEKLDAFLTDRAAKKKPQPEWSFIKPAVTFWGENSMTHHWEQQTTYGGKLTENIVQALARDILAEALIRVEAAGYPVVFHVHDEIIAEVPIGYGDLDEFCAIMSQAPAWAKGMPIAAAGWRGKRYRK